MILNTTQLTDRLHKSPQSEALGLQLLATDPDVILKVPYRADLVGEPATGVIAGRVGLPIRCCE